MVVLIDLSHNFKQQFSLRSHGTLQSVATIDNRVFSWVIIINLSSSHINRDQRNYSLVYLIMCIINLDINL